MASVVAVAAVAAFVTPGYLVSRTFDDVAVAQGVQRVLAQDYHLTVSGVRCPPGVEVLAGAVFECAATVDGRAVSVPVRVVSSGGAYGVGRPR